MSLKSYFETFNIADHERKVADGKAKRRALPPAGTISTPKPVSPRPEISKSNPGAFRLVIIGGVQGGKNNIIVTRTGHRFPKKSWVIWRDQAVAQVKRQLPADFKPFDAPIRLRMDYWAADARRRDQPAIIDAVFHCLERAGVVTDDWHLWIAISSRNLDRQNPRVEIEVLKAIE